MTTHVNIDRNLLFSLLAQLNQTDAKAEMMIGNVKVAENIGWCENMREVLAQARANVIEHLGLEGE